MPLMWEMFPPPDDRVCGCFNPSPVIKPLFLKKHLYVLVIHGNESFMDDVTEWLLSSPWNIDSWPSRKADVAAWRLVVGLAGDEMKFKNPQTSYVVHFSFDLASYILGRKYVAVIKLESRSLGCSLNWLQSNKYFWAHFPFWIKKHSGWFI